MQRYLASLFIPLMMIFFMAPIAAEYTASVSMAQTRTLVMPAQGGTGKDTSHTTGCAQVNAGIWSFPTCSGGGGGDCGPLAGDATSTDCGNNNLTTPTDSDHLQAFGYNNLNDNEQDSNVIGIGNGNGNNQEANEVILIGDTNGAAIPFVFPTPADIIGIGNNNIDTMTGSLSDLICFGDQNCQNGAWLSSSIGIGNSNFLHNNGTSNVNSLSVGVGIGLSNVQYINTGDTVIGIGQANSGGLLAGSVNVTEAIGIGDSSLYTIGSNVDDVIGIGTSAASYVYDGSTDIIAIGDGALKQCQPTSGSCTPQLTTPFADVVAIGDGDLQWNAGSDIVAIGNCAISPCQNTVPPPFHNTASFLVAIGSHALGANSTGTQNVGIGPYAGCDGWVGSGSIGNCNQTGSNNTWIGYDSGPNTTTQLSNTIALGYQAHNTLSNQTVIGNDSTAEVHIFGTFFTPASSSAACTVPEFSDDSDYHYVCVATNTWKRVALSTF